MNEYVKIRQQLKAMLSPSRYEHTLSTQKEAIKLANQNGVNENKASLAALLHDCAKNMDTDEMVEYITMERMRIDEITMLNPSLLHAMAGKVIARYKFGVTDEDILGAIEFHTTGKPNMTKLQKIIFLADVIEETRHYDGVEEIREIAYKDMDKAIVKSLDRIISFILNENKLLHPNTIQARNYLIIRELEK